MPILMRNDHVRERVLDQVARTLVHSADYSREAVIPGYAFADYLGARHEVRKVDLAAFSEMPPSYRSACVAVKRVDEEQKLAPTLHGLKALGAPRVIALGPNRASIWTLRGTGEPEKSDEFPIERVARVIETNAADWSPRAMSRLAGLEAPGAYQLDFADLGLIPLIEQQVNEKIDRLIQEVLAGCVDREPSLGKNRRRFRELVRLLFDLLAAKVLADREHGEADRSLGDVVEAVKAARRHLGLSADPSPRSIPAGVQEWAWERIGRSFHFQNLSVDSLAFVYENSLVSPEARQRLGIHGTPRAIAEFVVGLLPVEDLPDGQEVIFEPCCGFAPFLLAAFRRLRSSALVGLKPGDRHTHLVSRLRGVELDPFSLEVGRLCLTLADFPNADGWELFNKDVFEPGVLTSMSSGVGAVLANPPFESFDSEEQERYQVERTEKPAELLRRVLESCSPLLLGMVLPRVMLDSERSGYRQLRRMIERDYREVDIVYVPDRLFKHSEAETVLLVARDRRKGSSTTIRLARIRSNQANRALEGRWCPEWSTVENEHAKGEPDRLRVDELRGIWRRTAHLPKLGEIAEIHRGVEYVRPLDQVRGGVVSKVPKPGFAPGVKSAQDLRPYGVKRPLYINVRESEIRCSGDFPWSAGKVIVNAARRRRGVWPLTAVPDSEGLWCYQNLSGIWPESRNEWPLELLAAVLNGPLANAFVAVRSNKRHVLRSTLLSIPLPSRSLLDVPAIVSLVHRVKETPKQDIVLQIDAEVLRGYDLPPRLERQLLSFFEGGDRPGFTDFRGFYPPGFESALPLHKVMAELIDQNRAGRLLGTVPVLHEPAVTEMFEEIANGFER